MKLSRNYIEMSLKNGGEGAEFRGVSRVCFGCDQRRRKDVSHIIIATPVINGHNYSYQDCDADGDKRNVGWDSVRAPPLTVAQAGG